MAKDRVDTEGMGTSIVTCQSCGAKNRLRQASSRGRYRCGSCRETLPNPFHRRRFHVLPFASKFGSFVRRYWKRGIAIAIGFVIFFFQPWTQYQWVVLQDSVPAYENFVAKYPATDYAYSARERIRTLKEDSVWQDAHRLNSIGKLRAYLRTYPDGKYVAAAKAQRAELADQQWQPLANSRSENAIRKFLKDYPETTKIKDAEKRIQQLYDDFNWVQEQGSVEAYRRYLERNPHAANRPAIEKKVIDLEVAAIAAGDHGDLPKAQHIRSDPGSLYAKVRIANDTGYALTVLYSGPDSKEIVIPVNSTDLLSLRVGAYAVAAHVPPANIRKYSGADEMQGGGYESRFYIETNPPFGTDKRAE